MKDLFGEEENEKQNKNNKDDFDMGLGDLDEETNPNNPEELNIMEEEDEKKLNCPNCKKQTEKIIYCSKCGAAFCITCAQTIGNDKVCPKCKTKVKI